MVIRQGQRWRWVFNGPSIKSDLIVEITPSTGYFLNGRCLQVISSNDTYDRIGFVQGMIQRPVGEVNEEIVSGSSILTYLGGQDAPT